jgi:hypothetical protein
MPKNKKFTIQLTEKALNIVVAALDCYSRLGINQFQYGLEANPHFNKLDYDKQQVIAYYLMKKICPDAPNIGIYHPSVPEHGLAFDIKKELEKWPALEKVRGIRKHYMNVYDGALRQGKDVPVFLDEKGGPLKDQVVFNIPLPLRSKIKRLAAKKKWDEVWECIDKHFDKGLKKGQLVRGTVREIDPEFMTLIVKEPYNI